MRPQSNHHSKKSSRKARQTLLGLAVGLMLSVGGQMAVWGADADSADPTVAKMENKFFQRTYPKDQLDRRLERIEKMVFGEAKTGSTQERLAKLLTAVPASSLSAPVGDESGSASPPAGSGQTGSQSSSGGQSTAQSQADEPVADSSKYPAVTAIEKRMLGKSYEQEPIDKRLGRLELKQFGKVSSSTDLSDRTDRLRQSSGVDVAKQQPSGSEWAEDDDIMIPTAPPVARSRGGSGNYGLPFSSREDQKTFSGRDIGADLNRAFGRASRGSSGALASRTPSGGGAASDSSNPDAELDAFPSDHVPPSPLSSSGSYGMGMPGFSQSNTRRAPSMMSPSGKSSQMGLSQTISALEHEVLSKSYSKDPLPDRLTRLEQATFPGQPSQADKSLPERVNRLLAAIPLSHDSTRQASKPDDDDDMDMSQMAQGMGANGQRGGLNKIINSIGKMMNNGYSGGYPMSSGSMMTDPSTGMLIDPSTGNIIDPNSGMIIGRRISSPNYGGVNMGGMGMNMGGVNMGGMGMPGMGGIGINMGAGGIGMPGFNNGFSPYGSPYGGIRTGGMGIGVPGLGVGSGMGGFGTRW